MNEKISRSAAIGWIDLLGVLIFIIKLVSSFKLFDYLDVKKHQIPTAENDYCSRG
ncbi:MAG: hypothetical protein ABSF79_10235 [Smithellaceae bacterium]|jgi:hypothetical protein